MPANTSRGYTYPLYTDPINIPSDLQDFATDVDGDVQTLVNQVNAAQNRPSVRVTATANQSITQNTDVLATFATEAYDNNNMADLAVDNTRIQLQQNGIYLLTTRITFAAASPAAFVCFVRMNSSAGVIGTPGQMSITGDDARTTEITIEQLHVVNTVIPDNITVTVRHTFTAAINISARSLTATKIAATFTGT